MTGKRITEEARIAKSILDDVRRNLDAIAKEEGITFESAPPGDPADRSTFIRALQGQRESFERTRPLCSDHVDKMSGECLGCRIDRLKRELAREVSWGIAQMDFASRALAATLEGKAPPSDSYLRTAGIPDPTKVTRFLLDALTGGALSSLICAVRDTMIDGDRSKRPPSQWAHVENLKSNLRALGEDIP